MAFPNIFLSNPFFEQFPCPVQIREHRPDTPPETVDADLSIIVTNPLTSHSPQEHEILLRHAHPFWVMTALPSVPVPASKSNAQLVPVLYLDPVRARRALDSLQRSFRSAEAVAHFQSEYAASGLSSLTEAIQSVFESLDTTSESPAVILRKQRVLSRLRGALSVAEETMSIALNVVDRKKKAVSDLDASVKRARVTAQSEILGTRSNDIVEIALAKAKEDMKEVMDALTWWKLLWRADEIGLILAAALERHWCKALEERVSTRSHKHH
jgi:hypothetical protein